jgi:hypothetical protein
MYSERLLMMSAWRSKHVELDIYRQKIKIYHRLYPLLYLLEYMKMHGPGNIKFVILALPWGVPLQVLQRNFAGILDLSQACQHAIYEIFCWWISPSSKRTVTDGPSRQASFHSSNHFIYTTYTHTWTIQIPAIHAAPDDTHNLPTQCPSLKRTCDIFLHALAEVGCVYRAVRTEFLCDIQRTVHRDIFLLIKTNEMHYFSNIFDKVLYMFRTVPLSIIRSISTLYTQQ